MTEFLIYQAFDLLNGLGPLWLVGANWEGADLRTAILFDAILTRTIMSDGSVHE